jgi:hypothetical protein
MRKRGLSTSSDEQGAGPDGGESGARYACRPRQIKFQHRPNEAPGRNRALRFNGW